MKESHLCLEEDDALLLRRAPGDLELRELEFEELRSEQKAGRMGEGGEKARIPIEETHTDQDYTRIQRNIIKVATRRTRCISVCKRHVTSSPRVTRI